MAGSKVAVLAALVGNFLIAVAKLAGGIVSQSAAMFAEAAHSFSDTGNQVLLLIGIRRSDAPPSERHPFGTGKSAYFWPFLVAVLLFGLAGGYSVAQGVRKVLAPHPVEHIGLSLGILAIAFVIESATLWVAIREARRGARVAGVRGFGNFLRGNRDASLLTVLVEDSLALLGLPVAATGLLLSKWTGSGVWDGIASIVIGGMLMCFALFLGREIHDLLLGEAIRRGDLNAIRAAADEDPDVVRLENVRTMHLGPDSALLGADVVVRPGLTGDEVLAAMARLEGEVKRRVPLLQHIYLEPQRAQRP